MCIKNAVVYTARWLRNKYFEKVDNSLIYTAKDGLIFVLEAFVSRGCEIDDCPNNSDKD